MNVTWLFFQVLDLTQTSEDKLKRKTYYEKGQENTQTRLKDTLS